MEDIKGIRGVNEQLHDSEGVPGRTICIDMITDTGQNITFEVGMETSTVKVYKMAPYEYPDMSGLENEFGEVQFPEVLIFFGPPIGTWGSTEISDHVLFDGETSIVINMNDTKA